MENQTLQLASKSIAASRARRPGISLRDRADEVLVAIAVLGLVASIADGDADSREIDNFTRNFKNRFALSNRNALRIIQIGLRRIRLAGQGDLIACACDTLNEYLELSQKMQLFDSLSEVIIADGIVHEGEELFLDYIAMKLDLVPALEARLLE